MKITDIIIEGIVDEEILDEWSFTDDNIKNELIAKGYEFLGKGVDQSAYLEPDTGEVLKIFGTQGYTKGSGGMQLSRDQQMFVTWAQYCQWNSNNRFLPKFSGFERFEYKEHTYFQIRQERMNKFGESHLGWDLFDLSTYVENEIWTAPGAIANAFEKYKESLRVRNELDVFQRLERDIGLDGIQIMLSTCINLFNIALRHNWVFDLHDENFMMRDDGTPVIVDPWVCRRHSQP